MNANSDWRATLEREFKLKMIKIQRGFDQTIRLSQISNKPRSAKMKLIHDAVLVAKEAELRVLNEMDLKAKAFSECEKVKHAREDMELDAVVEQTVAALRKEAQRLN